MLATEARSPLPPLLLNMTQTSPLKPCWMVITQNPTDIQGGGQARAHWCMREYSRLHHTMSRLDQPLALLCRPKILEGEKQE